jgi:hypothetical protein
MGGKWLIPSIRLQLTNQAGAFKHADLENKFNFVGGINTAFPAVKINENESSDESGWGTDKYPSIHTNLGRVQVGAQGNGWTRFLGVYLNTTLVRVSGTKLQNLINGTWVDIGTVSDLAMSATNFEVAGVRAMIFTNGTDNVKWWNGVANLTDLSGNPPKGKLITNDTVRVWIAKDDILFFSGYLNAQDWTSNKDSGFIEYFTDQGGDITGLVRYQGSIVVFKVDHMAEIHGTNYFEFKLIDVSTTIGTVSAKSVQEASGILFFLGAKNVYAYSGGIPVEIGEPIRKFIDSINQTHIDLCWGGTDGISYYLGLVTGSFTTPNVVLSYNPRIKIWRVFKATDTINVSTLLGSTWYTADVAGIVWKMTGYLQSGVAQTSTIITKPFDEGSPELEKEYFDLYLQAFIPNGSSIAIYFSTSTQDDDFTLIDTITGTDTTPDDTSTPHIIPLDTLNTLTRWARVKLVATGEVIIHEAQLFYDIHPIQY